MRMCDDGHEEVVYECRECPLCKAMREIAELERENSELKDELYFQEKKRRKKNDR